MNLPNVAVVILNYNGWRETVKCLKSVLLTDYPHFTIHVIDNGSKHNELAILKRRFSDPRIVFHRIIKNVGYSGGNNYIFDKVHDKYIALVNNDVEVPRDWLKPLVRVLERDKTIAIVQPKILWFKNKRYFDYSGACGGYIDIFGYPFTRGRIFNTIEEDNGQYDKEVDLFWASGATMLMRMSALRKVGGFDERFFNYMEEIDLCFRLHRAGYRVVFTPKSYVYHKVAATLSRKPIKKRFWEHRNNILMIIKNYPLGKLFFILPIRIFFEYLSFIYYLGTQQFDYALAVIYSQISLFYMGPLFFIERLGKSVKETSKMKKIIYSNSIVVDYYLFKKRHYHSLKWREN
jgi:hypothetical protein